ncbi:MAG TPA: beta-ketoacyl synthase N-terminal-like domain-containing protein [Thermoanaerobaculia bacterium]|nr:beta-ketoacyl synthase N-terminal-like domain-containing protein [Thermoanaerobaculia bacterium]
MTRRVVVTGAGVVSPLGHSPAALHQALAERRSARRPIELFATAGIGCHEAGEIRPFDARAWVGERNLRPLDRTGRLLVVAAQLALADSGWSAELRARHEVGLVLGTMFCSIRTIAEFDRRGLQLGPTHVSPMDFANSVINAAAGQAAIWHGLRGVNSTLAAGEASGLLAIAQAADLIRGGRAAALLAGGAEELCFESFFGLFRAGRLCGSQDPEDPANIAAAGRARESPIPFDARRNGFSLSEGAALLMLEDAEAAAARGAVVQAELAGHGSAFDTSRGGPAGAAAMARAIRIALDDAGVSARDVDWVSASANGSMAGDRNEAAGIAAALGDHAAGLPVTAVKAMLGEALGASGALQAVELIAGLRDGVLPGILGLEATEDGFPLSGLSAETRRLPPGAARCALATALSADGHCSALVFAAPERQGGDFHAAPSGEGPA